MSRRGKARANAFFRTRKLFEDLNNSQIVKTDMTEEASKQVAQVLAKGFNAIMDAYESEISGRAG